MSDRMSDRMLEHIPERMSDRISEYIYICHIYFQMVCQKLYQNGVSEWGSLEENIIFKPGVSPREHIGIQRISAILAVPFSCDQLFAKGCRDFKNQLLTATRHTGVCRTVLEWVRQSIAIAPGMVPGEKSQCGRAERVVVVSSRMWVWKWGIHQTCGYLALCENVDKLVELGVADKTMKSRGILFEVWERSSAATETNGALDFSHQIGCHESGTWGWTSQLSPLGLDFFEGSPCVGFSRYLL